MKNLKNKKYLILVDYNGLFDSTMKYAECISYDKAVIVKTALEEYYKENPCYSVRIKPVEIE